MTTNQLRYHELQETKRSNRAKELETERHNRRQEGLDHDKTVSNTLLGLVPSFRITKKI